MEQNADAALTEAEAAARLRVSRRTLQDWRARGIGPRWIRYNGARAIRYLHSDLDAFIKNSAVVRTGVRS